MSFFFAPIVGDIPPGRQCFTTNWENKGNFSTTSKYTSDGSSEISFQFKAIEKWDARVVANSWTNPNSNVDDGETNVPMRFVKASV